MRRVNMSLESILNKHGLVLSIKDSILFAGKEYLLDCLATGADDNSVFKTDDDDVLIIWTKGFITFYDGEEYENN